MIARQLREGHHKCKEAEKGGLCLVAIDIWELDVGRKIDSNWCHFPDFSSAQRVACVSPMLFLFHRI